MSYSGPKELIQAEKLIEEGKIEKALQIVNDFGKKKDLSHHERTAYYIVKSYFAFLFFDRKNFAKYAKMGYQESKKLENSLLLLDVHIRMAGSLLFNFKINEASEFIKKSEGLLKRLPQELSTELTKRKTRILLIKGVIFQQKGEFEKAKEYLEESLVIQEKLDLKVDIALSLFQLGQISWQNGDLNRALEYIESSKILFTNFNLIHFLHRCYMQFGIIYHAKGELDRGLWYNEQVLAFAEKEKDVRFSSVIYNNIGNLYKEKGDYDRALEYLEKSLAIGEEILLDIQKFGIIDSLFHLALNMNDLEQAQRYLNRIKQTADQEKDLIVDLLYRIDRAVYLKNSPRALNRGKAEEILKQVIEEGIHIWEFLIIALLNLCDLLLFELHATGEPEILDELQAYISQLFDAVKNSRSYSLLAETYLLQARLSLITLDMIKARQFLTKAQEIADKYGLNRLAIQISDEHDELLNKLDVWEKLKETKAPLTERMKLARPNEQMERMIRKREIKKPVLETEQPVLLNIISKENSIIFSNPFTADMTFDANRIVDFLSAFHSFSDQIFYENLDRVKFLNYTVLMRAIDSLTISYIFKGKSYSARQKLVHFNNALKNESEILGYLISAAQDNQFLTIREIPSIEEIITESFLSNPQKFQVPFKAYEGEEPFLFASYSHVDKLHVYAIIDYLYKGGMNIWYDEGIPISENWRKVIVENIEKCKAFLVFITPHILDSEYVQKEINFALKKRKAFFAVYIKETTLPSELEFELSSIQHIKKYLMPDSEFYTKLKTALSSVLSLTK